jgi:hypothetical protein
MAAVLSQEIKTVSGLGKETSAASASQNCFFSSAVICEVSLQCALPFPDGRADALFSLTRFDHIFDESANDAKGNGLP